MSGVGLSQVNFDVQGLGDDEEQQLEKEDEERERELHELLSNELPEELLDDDNFSSQGLGSSSHGHRTPEFNLDQSFEHHHREDVQVTEGQEGTNAYYHPEQHLLTRRGEEFIRRSGVSTNHQSAAVVHPDSIPRGYGFDGGGGGTYGYGEELVDRRGYEEANGGEYLDQGNVVHGNQGFSYAYQSDGTSHVDIGQVGRDDGGGGSDNGGYHQDGDYDQMVDYQIVYPLVDPVNGKTSDPVLPLEETRPAVYPLHDRNFNEVYPSHGGGPRLQEEPYDSNDTFKVQYTRNKSLDVSDSKTELKEPGKTDEQSSIVPPSSELAQLQVLHRARGRKLEEITQQMALKEKEYERQIRILNHQLSLMKGERDGMAASLKHAQEVASDRKKDISELQRRLRDLEMEKERTNTEKDETESEFEAAKKTIESLHQQLMELEKSESLSRAREQHENVVMATRKRYEEDVVRLKQKLDDVNNTLLWKNEESKRLNDELTQARKEADRVRLDRAETVNRLTKSLEQSQRQNEELLNAGSTQEISHLQSQLQRTQREKVDLQEHYKTMETDLVDLQEQLHTYESVSRLGLKNVTITPLAATDNVKRNLAADEWRTPAPCSNQRNFSTEEALTGLQKELQLCLARNRSKREEIEQLRSQFDVVKNDMANKEMERERMEILVKKQEIKALEQEKKIAVLEELAKHPERRDEYRESELKKMKIVVEEYGPKLQQYVKREEQLEQLNLQLKSQMSEMVREYDADQQKSLEQCRQSCLQFHDEAMSTMKEQLKEEHEEQVKKLRLDLESISSELDQAKESYVVLSEETRWIEKQTRERCEEETKEKIKESQAKRDQDKSCEMMELRQSVVIEMERNFALEKASWQKNEEGHTRSKIETEIALAKMDWAKDQEKRRRDAVESALRIAQKDWMEKYTKSDTAEAKKCEIRDMKREWEREKEEEFEQRMDALRKELMSNIDKEHDGKLRAAREEWDRIKAMEIEREIEKAKRNWDEDIEKLVAKAKESSVALAKAQWSREQAEIRHDDIAQKIEEIKSEALAAAKRDLETISDMRIENILQSEKAKWRAAADEERERALETAVLLAEETWRTQHQDKISEAVKEALEVAQNSWKKEREYAIESAVTQSLDSAKEMWNKNKVQEIEQILSSARKQWLKEFGIQSQESTPGTMKSSSSRKSLDDGSTEETNKVFSYLEAQYTKNLKEFQENELKRVLEENERQKCIALKELESNYEMKLNKLEEDKKQKLKDMAEASKQDREAELKKLETAYERKLQGIIDEIEERYTQEKEAIEKDWVEKYEGERGELEAAYRATFQKEREGMGRELQEKYANGIEKARKKLEHQFQERLQSAVESAKHDWEEEQEEDRVALEEQHVKKLEAHQKTLRMEMEEQAEVQLSQAKNDALVATRQLEEKFKNEKTRYTQDIESLQRDLRDLKQRVDKPKDHQTAIGPRSQLNHVDERSEASQIDVVRHERWTSLAEISDDVPDSSRLHELRKQYLNTAAQLKDDFMQHAVETRKNAAKAIRSEVMKERHATAKRLRKYYLECLKQILDDDKEAFRQNQNPRSNQEKMRVMDERLRLPDEAESIMSSTLTNVTALPDGISEHQPFSVQSSDANVTSATVNTSPRGKLHNIDQDHRLAQNDMSRDTNARTSSPRNSTTEGHKPAEVQRTDGRELAGNEWVNYSRRNNHGEAIDPAVKPPALQGGKDFSKGSNLPGLLVSSMDSLLSIDDDRQIDLPSVINFRQQQIPKLLLQPEDKGESETSSSTGLSDSSRDDPRRRERSHDRSKPNRSRHAKESEWNGTEKVRHCENGERTHKLVTKTRTSKDSTARSQPYVGRTSPGKFSHPVIATKTRNEQPTKLTSSLLKPIGDVLPSKPLSPVSRTAPKFSYTMHSGSRKTR